MALLLCFWQVIAYILKIIIAISHNVQRITDIGYEDMAYAYRLQLRKKIGPSQMWMTAIAMPMMMQAWDCKV